MAETLINSTSDAGGDVGGFLRSGQHEITEDWIARAASAPPHRAICPPEMLNEMTSLVRHYLSAVADHLELGPCADRSEALKPLAHRMAAACIPLRCVERSLGLLRDVVNGHLRRASGGEYEPSAETPGTIDEELEAARSEVVQLYLDAILGRLRDAEEKYLSVMKNAAEALFVCDPEIGAILEANRRAEELSGYRAGTLVGMRLDELENQSVRGRLAEAFRRVLEKHQAVVLECVSLTRRDGAHVTADVRVTPFHTEGAPRQAVLVSMQDTTCERELEERVRTFSEQLDRTATEKTQEIAALTRLTSAISSGADIEKIFQIVVFEIGKLVSFDQLSIALLEEDGEAQPADTRYRVAVTAGKTAEHFAEETLLPVKGSLVEHVASVRKPVLYNDLKQAGQFEEARLLLGDGLTSCVCAPLMTGRKLVGALLLCSARPGAFGRRDVAILQDVGEQVAVALQWAKLRQQERRRKAEMKIINEVGREAMSTLDLKKLLKAACASIQHNFASHAASIYLRDWKNDEIECAAHAGAAPDGSGEGTRIKIGRGLPGRAARSGKVVLVSDVSKDNTKDRSPRSDGSDLSHGSELCVPINVGGRVDGVLFIQSTRVNAFRHSSVSALETIADLIARAIEKARLYQRTSSLRELNENIIATMPSALLVLDENLNVVLANTAYYKLANLEKDEVEGKDIRDLWDEEFLKDSRLLACLRETLQTGKSSELKNIRHYWPGRYVMLNFGMSCIPAGEQPRVVLMIEDVTETVERAFRLSMLREMNEAIQSTLELDKILRLVLTCVTAGHALAFNRGFLFMVNKRRNLIEGTTGIGPVSLEDARNIYSDSALKTKSLQQLLSECDFSVPKEDLPLYDLARKMSFRLDEDDEIVIRTIKEKKTFLVLDAENDERVSSRCRAMLGANSFVSVPLVAKDEAIGVIVADNIYSGHPITPERAELLALFANHAGLAIENGESYARLQKEIKERIEAYQRLEEIQEREVRTGQLAAIGEMAARVAHEIRNPLVNIGLLARQILRSVSSGDHRHDKADVIVNEVMRLEKILTDVVDFSRPATPNKLPMSIDAVVDQVTGFVRPQLKDRNIQLVRAQKTPVPQIAADPAQIKQALLNIVKNAIEAVEQNGTITINTWCDGRTVAVDVVDTGPGIVDYVLENMYDLFYTTKQGGSGLGLAITRKIIEDHRGSLSVQSTPGEGTTFTVQLPVQAESENWPPAQASIQGGPQL